MFKRFYIILLLLNTAFILDAQNILNGVGVETNGYFGRLARHSSRMLAPITGLSDGASLNITYQTNGKHAWQRFYKLPSIGLKIGYQNIDNGAYYGEAAYTSVYIERYLKIRKNYKTYLRTVAGAAYLNKKYDFYTNPLQNSIGSHWNLNFSFLYGYQWKLNNHFFLNTGAGVIHFSNGGATSQNLGLNVLALQFGVKYVPSPHAETPSLDANEFKAIDKTWNWDLEFNVGLKEQNGVHGGPFYPIYNYSIGTKRDINRRFSWLAGAEYEYYAGVRNFLEHIQRFESEERFWQSSRVGVFAGTELWYDKFSLTIKMGAFLTNNYKQKLPVFNKFGIRYYILDMPSFKAYVGIAIKTELIVANYVSGTVGFRF